MITLKVQEVARAHGIDDPVALASKADIAYATAYRLWQGNIGTEGRGVGILVLHKVARALGVRLWDLMDDGLGKATPARVAA